VFLQRTRKYFWFKTLLAIYIYIELVLKT
jgi:hypothetical protein